MNSKIDGKRMRPAVTATALAVLLTLGSVTSAEARGPAAGGAHAQRGKPAGHSSYSRHTEVQRTDHGHKRTDTWTGENGKSATRNAEVVNDRATQTRTRDVQWTGPNGQQATRTDVTQRTADGYTRDSTATGPQGGTVQRDVVATRDQASQTWVKDVTVVRTPPPGGN